MNARSGLSIICFLLILSGCSQKRSGTHTEMVISFGSITGVTFVGGAVVQIVNELTKESKLIKLVPPYNVTIPFGTWSLHFVGFEGTDWKGPHACGGVKGYKFVEDNQTVQISVNATNCAIEPYLTLKDFNLSKWDEAIWDISIWE